MPIFHQLETGEQYAKIPRALLDEKMDGLSKSVLCYLLSKPPKWKTRVTDIMAHFTNGERSIRRALDELRALGYVHYSQTRNGNRMGEGVWTICDKPTLPQHVRFAHAQNEDAQNAHRSKIDLSKIDLSQSKGSKESEETSALPTLPVLATPEETFPAMWKPDKRTKKEQLAAIKPPKDFPSEREFTDCIERNELDGIKCKRDKLYSDLTDAKWHRWTGRQWQRISDWEAFIIGLDAHLNSFDA